MWVIIFYLYMTKHFTATTRVWLWLVLWGWGLALTSCQKEAEGYEHLLTPLYTPRYAPGFALYSIEGQSSTLVRVYNPWQGAEGVQMDTYIKRGGEEPPRGFTGQVVEVAPDRVVALSSSYIGMLQLLGEVERVVAVSGKQYIANPFIAAPESGVVELGNEIDYERLLSTAPQLLLCYGVDAAQSALTSRLEELGVPYLYLGEYLEENPLGRTEWLVLLAEVLDKREEGIRLFANIEQQYLALAELSKGIAPEARPTVMLNMPWNDAWFLPSSRSYMAQLIRDAGGTPITANDERKSTAIGLEEALSHLATAHYWLHPGQATEEHHLPSKVLEHKAELQPLRLNHVYNNNAQITPAGGSNFYEQGVVEPYLILQDLLLILHPDLLPATTTPTYYRHIVITGSHAPQLPTEGAVE